jgi:Trk K+ transport system NAD-binding subunit
MASTYKDHVIICGLGKVGYRVALELLKMGRDVVGIELNGDGRFVQEALAQGIPVLVADARRPETLERAGIRNAHVIIPATENELTNLDIALDARELNPDVRVVMRMFDPDLARRVEKGFGLNTAYSVSALAAPVFAAAAMRTDVKASFYAGDTLLNVIEVLLGPMSGVTGRTVASLESEFDVSVVARFGPDGVDLRPAADVVLTPGDRLYVLGPLDRLSHVNRANDGATGR